MITSFYVIKWPFYIVRKETTMLNIREYQKDAKDIADRLKNEFGNKKHNQINSIHPIFKINGKELSLASFIEPSKKDELEQFGVLHIFSRKEIMIYNVTDYRLCINVNSEILVVEKYNILEADELDDFYVICICPLEINECGFYCNIISYRLEIYHNDKMIYKVDNVERYYDVGNNLKILYSIKKKEKYEHWFYNNGISEFIITDDKKYISKSEYEIGDGINPNIIFDDNGKIEIRFHEVLAKGYFILKEFAKNADEFYLIDNQFEDDNTSNYIVKYSQNRIDDIAFVSFCLSRNTDMIGHAIYNIPIQKCRLGLIGTGKEKIKLIIEKMKLSKKDEDLYTEIIIKLYRKYDKEINLCEFPEEINSECEKSIKQIRALNKFLEENHPAYIREKLSGKKDFYEMLDRFKNKYNVINQDLIAKGEYNPKWKSEYELFQLLKKEYNDAIYQYRARWLGYQSLDIFIPSESLAFEYQGQQHYKPVEVFGGMEHFQLQIKLDKKKRELCILNNVKLIEWRYDEPISRIILRKKLKKYNF